ncbi:hypothetical protein TIFTF001_022676 [Ficus carica]|uniref:Pentatricopeptide repeat-containing protein n=1 Tax=Ficus carica TaxID=3494 RepID=A0AA88AI90_FICCA|nr:hypothetical protein TIFTF001_022676 [Ficus carica]
MTHYCTVSISSICGTIKQLLSKGLYYQILQFYKEQVHPAALHANLSILPSIVKASATSPGQYLCSGLQLHCVALKSGCSSDTVFSNSLITMYAKSSISEAAHKVFDEMPRRDIVSWSSIINCNLQNGHFPKALKMLSEMYLHGFVPKPELMASIISFCARTKELRLGREIHALVVTDRRIQESAFLSTALVDFYFKCHHSLMAFNVFNLMAEKNEVTWTTIISGCAASLNFSMAMHCLQAMQVEGVSPNRVTVMSILPVYAELGYIKHGKVIHAYAIRRDFHSDPHFLAALVHMYSKCEGASPASKLIFERSTARDVVLWSSIIGSYSQHGHEAKAVKLFNQMQVEGTKPNSVTLLALISASTSLSSLDLSREVHSYALKYGLNLDIFISNALINMYGKCGCINSAQQIFMEMSNRDSVSWSTIIGAYGLHGCGEQALRLFHEMQKAGVEADKITVLAVLSACGHAGLVEEGQKIFHHASRGSKEIPWTLEHYACYIDLLGRAGKLEDACEVARTMPMEANPKIWSSLISSCKLHGRLEVAELLAHQLLKSEPESAANYTLLSMVYAEKGNWLAVEEVRRTMKLQGVKKCYSFSRI